MGQAHDTAERFYALFGAGDLDGALGLFASGCVTITPVGPLDNAAHQAFGAAFRAALPDAHMDVVRAVEAGDEVVISGRFKGTHSGELVSPQGAIPASGNAIDVPFLEYWRVDAGQIVAHEVIWDQLTMLTQLGAMPSPS
jgi:ketosteroid isomerase-like protein